MGRDVIDEIYREIRHYRFVAGKDPDVVFLNRTALANIAGTNQVMLNSDLDTTVFGIKVEEFICDKQEPEWYFGMRMIR